MPALLPQAYLHYDPYVRSQLADRLPQRTRVVLEIDGAQHYSVDGTADPKRYADMVAEDRALRLARHERQARGNGQVASGGVGYCPEWTLGTGSPPMRRWPGPNARHPWSHNVESPPRILRNLPAGRDAAVDIGCRGGRARREAGHLLHPCHRDRSR